MRGKDDGTLPEPISNRITPAYAGKRTTKNRRKKFTQDHPRLCGEKSVRVSLLAFATGSPPPMRGKEKHLFSALLDRGITPAYAGKSTGYVNHYPKSEDHPRLCGEKMF